jgi:hypothetical protein
MKSLQFFFMFMFVAFSLGCSKDDNANPSDPHGWILAGSLPEDYKIGNDNQNFHHGAQSGYLESISDTIEGFGTIMQFCSGDDFRGERVKMTGYVQTLAPGSSSTQMWVRVDDYDLQVTADFDNMEDRPIIGTRFWTKCEIVFDVPESNCVINYGMLLVSTGKAWFDYISFEIVDSSINKTAYYLNDPFPEGNDQLPENLPEHPVNLDFEE